MIFFRYFHHPFPKLWKTDCFFKYLDVYTSSFKILLIFVENWRWTFFFKVDHFKIWSSNLVFTTFTWCIFWWLLKFEPLLKTEARKCFGRFCQGGVPIPMGNACLVPKNQDKGKTKAGLTWFLGHTVRDLISGMTCTCSRKRWELEQEKAAEEEFHVAARDDVSF